MNCCDYEAWRRFALVSAGKASAFNSWRFEWSQFPGCGPAAEVFGFLKERRMLELGCGTGTNAAVLARDGAVVLGVDVAAANIVEARTQSATQKRRPTFLTCSAEDILSTTDSMFDCIYSVFGAISFVDPRVLLPLVGRCLVPGGNLIFSVRHVEWDGALASRQDCRVVQHSLPTTGAVVRRFDLGRHAWSTALRRHGFMADRMFDILAPSSKDEGGARSASRPCCLLIAARHGG